MKSNSIIKKFALVICGIGITVCILINIFLPSLFFEIMKPHFINYIASAANSNSLRISYIWQSNINNRPFLQNDNVYKLINDFYNSSEDKSKIKDQLVALLPDIQDRSDGGDEGAIASSNNFLVITEKGDFFYNDYASRTARVISESDWYQNYKRTGTAETGHIPVITDKYDPEFQLACKVISFYVGDIECFLFNTINFDYIYRQFQVFDEFNINDFLIYSDQKIIYKNLGNDSNIKLDDFPPYMFEGIQYETKVWKNGNQINFMTLCTYPQDEYRVAVTVSKDTLLAPYEDIFRYLQYIFTGFAALLLILFFITLRGLLHRIVKMDKKMDKVRNGDYNVVITDKRHDEIGNLANTFNMMLDKIKKDMINEQKMQYTLMVSAIDPHYIYNTLNTVTALARLGRNEDVVTVNNALISTLKDRVKMKNYKTFDSVENELNALKQYMVIQNYLCYQKIELEINVDNKDLNLSIPKNVIQPLVENSIKHGILCNEDENGDPVPGVIKVGIYGKDDIVTISIEDNGTGMTEETIGEFFNLNLPEEITYDADIEHIGIYNIKMRLNYLYSNKYNFLVQSHIGHGTNIQIIIPRNNT